MRENCVFLSLLDLLIYLVRCPWLLTLMKYLMGIKSKDKRKTKIPLRDSGESNSSEIKICPKLRFRFNYSTNLFKLRYKKII